MIFIILGMLNTEVLKLSYELNKTCTYQILLDLIVQFLLLLNTFYNMYLYLMSLNLFEVLSDIQIIKYLIWISLFSIKVIFLNNYCTKFYHEVEVTAHLLRDLDICYLDNSIRNEVQQFLLQVHLHPLKFTAGGYILNNKFLTMFFGTIITYSVVLVQMNSLSISN
ncbi:uncharacterized protein LOC122715536 [Apis laboriosa]|uniref:uncharacterized protein LOC122715536 n=1 Tax=Apis laboriosa TaxID=183418 RepID=UPI001CC61B60|nr:uncharacterized protein LOC122715536 [Apis laboriosa]